LPLLSVALLSDTRTASHVCVYNDVAAVISWKLRDTASGNESSRTSHFPVWQTKCLPASSVGSAGSAVVPVADAILGKEVVGDEAVLEDPVSISTVNYNCKGTTLSYTCKLGPPGPSPGNITKDVGEFLLGFAKGLALKSGFADCITDLASVAGDIKAIVDFFESGFNAKSIGSIVRAFELIGELLKDSATAISACIADAKALVQKVEDAAAALSGNVWAIIKVLVEDALRIFHDRKEITQDCKTMSADWKAGDFQGSGEALGEVVGVIISDIDTSVEAPPLVNAVQTRADGQCAKAAYAYCCGVGKPCDCTKGTTAPGQCQPESYVYCCDVGTPCDCAKPGEPADAIFASLA